MIGCDRSDVSLFSVCQQLTKHLFTRNQRATDENGLETNSQLGAIESFDHLNKISTIITYFCIPNQFDEINFLRSSLLNMIYPKL